MMSEPEVGGMRQEDYSKDWVMPMWHPTGESSGKQSGRGPLVTLLLEFGYRHQDTAPGLYNYMVGKCAV